ncbi:mediator of RNA polymerase II transcription subunit 9-like [Argonauta hians]
MAKNFESELSFLHIIYEIIRSIEKDSHDVPQKVTDLKNRLQRGREIVDGMAGIQHTREEQMKHIEVLRKQLITKCDLIKKYKNFHSFNLSR